MLILSYSYRTPLIVLHMQHLQSESAPSRETVYRYLFLLLGDNLNYLNNPTSVIHLHNAFFQIIDFSRFCYVLLFNL